MSRFWPWCEDKKTVSYSHLSCLWKTSTCNHIILNINFKQRPVFWKVYAFNHHHFGVFFVLPSIGFLVPSRHLFCWALSVLICSHKYWSVENHSRAVEVFLAWYVVCGWLFYLIMTNNFACSIEFQPKEYMTAAEKAASFIRRHLYNEQAHRLEHSFRNGPSKAPGFLDDYAFLISGLLDLYEVGGGIHWLVWATELQNKQVKESEFISLR